MSDPIANRTLELACTVGSIDDAIEAIEDGADVNLHGGAPLFLAIMNRNRDIIDFLLEEGADAEGFIAKKKLSLIHNREDLVEELIASAPYNPRDVKPDQIEEIDSGIRESGVSFLVSDLDWDKAARFRDSLDAIGAGTTHRCVAEFLQWARSENGANREGINDFLTTNHDAVSEYRDRYLTSGENLVELAAEFVSSSETE